MQLREIQGQQKLEALLQELMDPRRAYPYSAAQIVITPYRLTVDSNSGAPTNFRVVSWLVGW